MKEGDLINFEYEGWTEGNLFDTTNESLAKKNDMHDERKNYTPLLVVVGEGRLVPGLEKDLKKAKVGEKREVVIAPVDGYGERDTKLIQTESLSKIRRLNPDAQLFQGAEIELEGKHGQLVAIFGSRARIDYNHYLSGKELTFKYKVSSKISKEEEKISSLFKLNYPVDEDIHVSVKKNSATITLPERYEFDAVWFQAKYRVVSSLRKYAKIKDVKFVEEYIEKDTESDNKKKPKKSKSKKKPKKSASKKKTSSKKSKSKQ